MVNTAGMDAGYRTSTVVRGVGSGPLRRRRCAVRLRPVRRRRTPGRRRSRRAGALHRRPATPRPCASSPRPTAPSRWCSHRAGSRRFCCRSSRPCRARRCCRGSRRSARRSASGCSTSASRCSTIRWCPRQPASRPCDDEGTPSRRLPLVERGVVRGFVYDLETAARAQVASTGHGARGIFGKPHVDYSNLILGTRDEGRGTGGLGGGLSGGITDGLLIDDLIGVGQGNVIGGAFSHPVALAYRIERGADHGPREGRRGGGQRVRSAGTDRRVRERRPLAGESVVGVAAAGRGVGRAPLRRYPCNASA